MKKLILVFTIVFLNILLASAANKLEANPINIAVILSEKNDSATMASVCEFYGYQAQPSQDGYIDYHHLNGSIIRYSFSTADDGHKYATIEVISNISSKEQDKILNDFRFRKTGDTYERPAFTHTTRCSTLHGLLRFSNHPKIKK